MTEWSDFADGLAEQLATLDAGSKVLIIENAPLNPSRYAQFAQHEDCLVAQVVGDAWLDPAVRADEAGHRLLAECGWQYPESDYADNWWFEVPWPAHTAKYHELASMVVTGLRDAYGIAAPSDLYYTAWVEKNAEDRPLELPLLGLPSRD